MAKGTFLAAVAAVLTVMASCDIRDEPTAPDMEPVAASAEPGVSVVSSGRPGDRVPECGTPGGLGVVVVGGNVYRGEHVPQLAGRYVFGDFSRSFAQPDGSVFVVPGEVEDERGTSRRFTSPRPLKGRARTASRSYRCSERGRQSVAG